VRKQRARTTPPNSSPNNFTNMKSLNVCDKFPPLSIPHSPVYKNHYYFIIKKWMVRAPGLRTLQGEKI
jgi:hypothetical protein